jgi:hypothetical protein
MLGAIGLSTVDGPSGFVKSTAGIEVQLAQYEIQLSDWINCPSCKKPKGKAKIAEISDKISDIKQRVKSAEVQRQNAPTKFMGAGTSIVQRTDTSVPVANAQVVVRSNSPTILQTGSIGSRLNAFA